MTRVLTRTELNRATLARQSLSERVPLATVAAIERFGGLQAQEPASPYLALWTRLAGFDPVMLDAALREHDVVKGTLMRVTVHMVSAGDYLDLLPAVLPMLRQGRSRPISGPLAHGLSIPDMADVVTAHASEPRTMPELRDHLRTLHGDIADDLWWNIRRHAPFLHVPSEVAWSFPRRPTLIAASSWLPGRPFADEAVGTGRLVRRYLASFGPATFPDISQWSGLQIGRLRPAVAALEDIVRFRDEDGRELVDVAGGLLPPGESPAPVRLLPMWDSVLLAYADRSRMMPEAHRKQIIQGNGDVLPTFLVDGRVAGLWWAQTDIGESSSTRRIVFQPFGRLDR
ncbi:MAG: winged helix DNA-binding domain-containing protein, partial [Candidatus Limnocylindrales bacterium]